MSFTIDSVKQLFEQPISGTFIPDRDLNAGRGLPESLLLPINLDTIFSMEVQDSSEVTQLPVEGIRGVSDHIRQIPTVIRLKAGFSAFESSWKSNLAGNAIGVVAGQTQSILGTIPGIGAGFGAAALRNRAMKTATPKERLDRLRALKKSAVILSAKLLEDEFNSLVIVDLPYTVDRETGDDIQFEMTLAEMRFVEQKTIQGVPGVPGRRNKAKKKTESGIKPPTEPPAKAQEKVNQSSLKFLFGK